MEEGELVRRWVEWAIQAKRKGKAELKGGDGAVCLRNGKIANVVLQEYGEYGHELIEETEVPDLKALIWDWGVPAKLRGQIWPLLCHVSSLKQGRHYAALLSLCGETEETREQIDKDLHRTHPDVSGDPARVSIMRNILKAFAAHMPDLGYVQSMNFLTAQMLLHGVEEEDCFWCLTILVENILDNYFSEGMRGIQVDQQTLHRLCMDYCPCLGLQMSAIGSEFVMGVIGSSWLLSLFTNANLDTSFVSHVWDVVLFEGHRQPAICIALSILRESQDELLLSVDLGDFASSIQQLGERINEEFYASVVRRAKCISTTITPTILDDIVTLEDAFMRSVNASETVVDCVYTAWVFRWTELNETDVVLKNVINIESEDCSNESLDENLSQLILNDTMSMQGGGRDTMTSSSSDEVRRRSRSRFARFIARRFSGTASQETLDGEEKENSSSSSDDFHEWLKTFFEGDALNSITDRVCRIYEDLRNMEVPHERFREEMRFALIPIRLLGQSKLYELQTEFLIQWPKFRENAQAALDALHSSVFEGSAPVRAPTIKHRSRVQKMLHRIRSINEPMQLEVPDIHDAFTLSKQEQIYSQQNSDFRFEAQRSILDEAVVDGEKLLTLLKEVENEVRRLLVHCSDAGSSTHSSEDDALNVQHIAGGLFSQSEKRAKILTEKLKREEKVAHADIQAIEARMELERKACDDHCQRLRGGLLQWMDQFESKRKKTENEKVWSVMPKIPTREDSFNEASAVNHQLRDPRDAMSVGIENLDREEERLRSELAVIGQADMLVKKRLTWIERARDTQASINAIFEMSMAQRASRLKYLEKAGTRCVTGLSIKSSRFVTQESEEIVKAILDLSGEVTSRWSSALAEFRDWLWRTSREIYILQIKLCDGSLKQMQMCRVEIAEYMMGLDSDETSVPDSVSEQILDLHSGPPLIDLEEESTSESPDSPPKSQTQLYLSHINELDHCMERLKLRKKEIGEILIQLDEGFGLSRNEV